jgi:hypothetical protein
MARIAVRPRDELARYLLAFAVVALLALTGASLGRLAAGEGGASGSSSSGGGDATSSGSSGSGNRSDRADGSSNSGSRDGTSNSNGTSSSDDGSSGSGSGADDGGTGGTGGTVPSGGASPATTAPAGPTTTIAPTASTVPRDLPKGTPPSHEVACPEGTTASGQGGRVRCFEVDPDDVDEGDRVTRIGIPGVPVPVPLPAPVVVPVVNDTGDSGSTYNDHRVTVVYDIDNRTVVDTGAEEVARAGQRVAATLALLVLLPVATAVVLHLLRERRRPAPPSWPPPTFPPPTSPPPAPPPPRGRWVWQEEPPEDQPPEPPSGERGA